MIGKLVWSACLVMMGRYTLVLDPLGYPGLDVNVEVEKVHGRPGQNIVSYAATTERSFFKYKIFRMSVFSIHLRLFRLLPLSQEVTMP